MKSITPPSLEEVRKKLSEKSDSQSLTEEQGEVIDRGSSARGPRAERLRRYARLRSCFVADLGDRITSRAPKEDEIFEREDLII